MDTLKFNTFANSPKSQSANPSKFPTQQSLPYLQQSPYNSIPELKKQMQAALISRRTSGSSRKVHNKYSEQISIMKSDISLLSIPQISFDLPLSVLQLEVGVTEQILALREDKLTLLEQQNKIIDSKYRLERQIARLKKANQRQSSLINQISVFDNQNSSSKKKSQKNEPFMKDQNLRQQYENLRGQRQTIIDELQKQQEEQLLLEIQNLQQNSRILEQKITKIQQNARPSQDQRFQTFFPEKYQSPSNQNNKNLSFENLIQKRTALYKKLANQASRGQKSYLLELVDENEELLQKISRMNVKNVGITMDLAFLRQKVEQEKQAKQLFFQDLKRFKQQANKYRQSNQQMRKRLQLSQNSYQ